MGRGIDNRQVERAVESNDGCVSTADFQSP
jgi:hypothetical protein